MIALALAGDHPIARAIGTVRADLKEDPATADQAIADLETAPAVIVDRVIVDPMGRGQELAASAAVDLSPAAASAEAPGAAASAAVASVPEARALVR